MNDDKDSFENIAKELDCDESDDALDQAFDKLNTTSPPNDKQKKEDKEKPAE